MWNRFLTPLHPPLLGNERLRLFGNRRGQHAADLDQEQPTQGLVAAFVGVFEIPSLALVWAVSPNVSLPMVECELGVSVKLPYIEAISALLPAP